IVLSKGKFSMAALLTLVESAPASPVAQSNSTVHAPLKPTRRPTHIRKIVPAKCRGEFELDGVTFAYPSRPTMPVLQDVSIFLPSNETSFIVGGSGSGKSTIAQLLLQMYATAEGAIRLADEDTRRVCQLTVRAGRGSSQEIDGCLRRRAEIGWGKAKKIPLPAGSSQFIEFGCLSCIRATGSGMYICSDKNKGPSL
ncbi:hypothetical protein EVJ58_g10918, partial [Rhodofomes roseus]